MVDFINLMEARSLNIDSENDQDKFWHSDQWVMEPIYQGIRYQGLVYAPGKIKFHGKRKDYKEQNKVEQLSNIMSTLQSLNLPEQTLFECYLTFQNDRAKAFRFLKLEELDDDLRNNAQLFITDIIYHNGQDVCNIAFFDRRTILNKLFERAHGDYVTIQQSFFKDKQKVFDSLKDEIKVFLFKDLAARYSFNKQSSSSRIYKVPQSYFMSIMGIVESSNKKLNKMIVALEGGQFKNGQLTKIMNIPVHSNDAREVLYNNKEQLLGKVFEFLATEKNENEGKYQEARFVKLRDDKKLEDCIFI
ncbi:MAG: hypothetical protein PHF86_07775 [Candidatus Nanoarchaeia archaeon]|jgi:hypothetical protein|nr:hypothetical protein [Candidatus Nanoarchaeia archaeon]